MILRRQVFRAHHPKWAWAAESGEGAALGGGRFNPPGMPALYTALRLETAWLEAQQGFAYKAQPMTMCAYEVDCADMLDLTDPAMRARHGIAGADLACAWKDLATRNLRPPSWALAEKLIAAGMAGILVPSFAMGATANDVNAVFWSWGRDGPHRVRVIDTEGRLAR